MTWVLLMGLATSVAGAWALVRADSLPGVADVFRLRPRQR